MIRTAILAAALLATTSVQAMLVTPPDSTADWGAFMNVSNLPEDGGDYQFGSGWGVADLVVTFDDPSSTLTFSPNTIGDPDPYWYKGGGGPGAQGNKIMEANLFIQSSDGSLSGTTVTFEGYVKSNTLTPDHVSSVFIRDFAPDFSSFNQTIVPLSGLGKFSIDLATDPGAGRHVQYGFQMVGENVWVTDVAPFGNIVISAIPEPTAALAFGLIGLLGVVRYRPACD